MALGPGLPWGLLAAAAVGLAAWRLGALTPGGAAAAAAVGGVIFGWGGAGAALPLLFFFVTGSALSRWHKGRKSGQLDHADHQGRRAGQVMANGGVAAMAIVAGTVWPEPLWWTAYAGAIAAATADTWATEFGVLARRTVLITTGAPAPPGRSGAVSLPGTLAGVAGALLVAAISAVGPGTGALAVAAGRISVALSAAAGGILGMVVDSILGATIQARYFCPACNRDAESPVHRCGTRTRWAGGWPGVSNDVVNFCATLTGAAAAALVCNLLLQAA